MPRPPSATKAFAAALAVSLLACCSQFRWSGHHAPSEEGPSRSGLSPNYSLARKEAPERFEIRRATSPRHEAAPSVEEVPQDREVLYYSDLGPDSVDVTAYPAQQRYAYGVYARVCSQCHTLARSINAPTVSRAFWEFYLLRMRLRRRLAREEPLSAADKAAILGFLEHDSKVRKVDRAREFEAQTAALKERFSRLLDERMRGLQERQPQPLLPGEP